MIVAGPLCSPLVGGLKLRLFGRPPLFAADRTVIRSDEFNLLLKLFVLAAVVNPPFVFC